MTDNTNSYRKKWKSNIIEKFRMTSNLLKPTPPSISKSLKILKDLNTPYTTWATHIITTLTLHKSYIYQNQGTISSQVGVIIVALYAAAAVLYSNVFNQLAKIVFYSGTCFRKFTWFTSTVQYTMVSTLHAVADLHCLRCGSGSICKILQLNFFFLQKYQ